MTQAKIFEALDSQIDFCHTDIVQCAGSQVDFDYDYAQYRIERALSALKAIRKTLRNMKEDSPL